MIATPPPLDLVAQLQVTIGPPITIGDVQCSQMQGGLRRIIPITGGRANGPRIHGEILAGGADHQLIRSDGYTVIEARYAVALDDGDMIYVINEGVRYGSPKDMARLLDGKPVNPELVYFRTVPRFETSSTTHQWLLKPLFLGTGIRRPDSVEINIFEVR